MFQAPINNKPGYEDQPDAGLESNSASFDDGGSAVPSNVSPQVRTPKYGIPAISSIKQGVKNKATDTALGYAAQKVQDARSDKGINDKYGKVLDVAGDAFQRMQKKRADGESLGMKDAAKIGKEAAINHTGKAIKRGAQKKIAEQIAKHPELAARAGQLLDGSTKKLDLTGKGGDELAKGLAKKGLQNVAKAGGQQLANQAAPLVGSISARDAMSGIGKGAKQLSQGHAIKAATSVVTGVVKSVLVTAFRASYSWYVIGGTGGLSLIATWALGNILFLLPNRGMSFMEKLLVVALDILLLMFGLGAVMVVVAGACNSPVGFGIWAASWFSSTASQLNDLCAALPTFQQQLGTIQ